MAGPSGGGGQAPVPQATGASWMVGRLEQRNGEWAVLFPARGAGAPASEVAAFPCEDDARHLLRLLQLHALMRAQPSLRADQLPPELAAHILVSLAKHARSTHIASSVVLAPALQARGVPHVRRFAMLSALYVALQQL